MSYSLNYTFMAVEAFRHTPGLKYFAAALGLAGATAGASVLGSYLRDKYPVTPVDAAGSGTNKITVDTNCGFHDGLNLYMPYVHIDATIRATGIDTSNGTTTIITKLQDGKSIITAKTEPGASYPTSTAYHRSIPAKPTDNPMPSIDLEERAHYQVDIVPTVVQEISNPSNHPGKATTIFTAAECGLSK